MQRSAGVAAGWDAPDLLQSPPVLHARYARRIGRAHASAKWGPRQKGRSDVVKKLVAAGYTIRAWPITADPPICDDETGMLLSPVYRYTGGPCAGLPVVDAWVLAAKVAACGVRGIAAPTSGGIHASVTASPERCGLVHVCPVCASAAGTGDALRIVALSSRPTRTGALVLLTLTHRDGPPGAETLVEAWERFEDALGMFRVGIRDYLAGGKLTLETTDGAAHLTTHPHFHGVFELRQWITIEEFREFAATLWIECTRLAGGGRVVDQALDEARRAHDEAEDRAGVSSRATVQAATARDRARRHPNWTRERNAAIAADLRAAVRRVELAAAVAVADLAGAAVVTVEALAIEPWDRASGWTLATKKRTAHEGWCDEIAPATGERCPAPGDDCDGWTLLWMDPCAGDDCGDGYGWAFDLDTCGGIAPASTCAGVRCVRDAWDLPPDPPVLSDPTDAAAVATWAAAMGAWHAGSRAEWAAGQRSGTIAPEGATDTVIRDRAFQASKYPCPIADIADPSLVAEFVTWAASKHLIRWWGEWSGSEAQAWASAVVGFEGDEARRLARLEGDAPDVGWRLPAVKPTTLPEPVEPERERTRNPAPDQVTHGPAVGALSALGDEPIRFDLPALPGVSVCRAADDLRRFEAWSTMAGLMHRVDPILADTRPEAEYHAIRQRFRALRLRVDIPAAVAEWEAVRVELGLDQWTESALNGRDGERDRRAAIEAALPTPERAALYVPTERDRARIRAEVAASYDRR